MKKTNVDLSVFTGQPMKREYFAPLLPEEKGIYWIGIAAISFLLCASFFYLIGAERYCDAAIAIVICSVGMSLFRLALVMMRDREERD